MKTKIQPFVRSLRLTPKLFKLELDLKLTKSVPYRISASFPQRRTAISDDFLKTKKRFWWIGLKQDLDSAAKGHHGSIAASTSCCSAQYTAFMGMCRQQEQFQAFSSGANLSNTTTAKTYVEIVL